MIPLGVLASARVAPGGITSHGFLQATVDDVARTTYTFAGQNLGAADAARWVAVTVASRGASGRASTGATIAGVTATLAVQYTDTAGGSTHNYASIYYAAVPAGTSGDIVVTFAGQVARCVVGAYRIIGATAVSDTATSGADPAVLDVDTSAGDAVIACLYSNAYADNVNNWSGVTAHHGINIYSTASALTTTAETPRTVSVTPTNDLNRAAVAAVFH